MSTDPERGGNSVESGLTDQERLARIDYHYDALKDSLSAAFQQGDFNAEEVFERVSYLVALDATRDLPSLAATFQVIGQRFPGLADEAQKNLLKFTKYSAEATQLMLDTTKALKLPTDSSLTQTRVDAENWLRSQTIDLQRKAGGYEAITRIPHEPIPDTPTLAEAVEHPAAEPETSPTLADLRAAVEALKRPRGDTAPVPATLEAADSPTVPAEIKLNFTPEQEAQLRAEVMPLFMKIGQLINTPESSGIADIAENSDRLNERDRIEQQIMERLNLPQLPPNINRQLLEQRGLALQGQNFYLSDAFSDPEYFSRYNDLRWEAADTAQAFDYLFTTETSEPSLTQLCQALVDKEVASLRVIQFQIDEIRKRRDQSNEPPTTAYDPITISDEDLKKLPPAERAKVYVAQDAARASYSGPAEPAPATESRSSIPQATVREAPWSFPEKQLIKELLDRDPNSLIDLDPKTLIDYVVHTAELTKNAQFTVLPKATFTTNSETGKEYLDIQGALEGSKKVMGITVKGGARFHIALTNNPNKSGVIVERRKNDIEYTGQGGRMKNEVEDTLGKLNETITEEVNKRVGPEYEVATYHLEDGRIRFSFKPKAV